MKEKKPVKKEIPKKPEELPDEGEWSKDQRKRGYYYDDSHGYKPYVPEEDEEEEDAA